MHSSFVIACLNLTISLNMSLSFPFQWITNKRIIQRPDGSEPGPLQLMDREEASRASGMKEQHVVLGPEGALLGHGDQASEGLASVYRVEE